MQPIIDLSYKTPKKKNEIEPGNEPLGMVILVVLPFCLMVAWGVFAHL